MYLTSVSDDYQAAYTGYSWAPMKQWSVNVSSIRMWLLKSRFDTRVRADTGLVNSSPVPQVPPVNVVGSGTAVELALSYTDADNDIVRCRWSQSSKDECGGIVDLIWSVMI